MLEEDQQEQNEDDDEDDEAEQKDKAEQVDEDAEKIGIDEYDIEPFAYAQTTFRISRNTDILQLKKIATAHWDIEDASRWCLWSENIEKQEPNHFQSKNDRTVEKMVEFFAQQEFKFKDLAPAEGQPRHAIFYLGMYDHFEDWYTKFCERRVAVIERDKEAKKALEGEIDDEDDRGAGAAVLDEEPDKEQMFLTQFPNLSVFYRQNKSLFYKYRKKRDFKIAFGGWIAPTCCSLLINFIQWFLTFRSVTFNKGDGAAFWLPELVRMDLEPDFKRIQDVSTFWKFIEKNLCEYVFSDLQLIEDDHINRKMLNTFNMTSLAQNAKGRLYIGPMRFL